MIELSDYKHHKRLKLYKDYFSDYQESSSYNTLDIYV